MSVQRFIEEQVPVLAAKGLTPRQIAIRTGMSAEEIERRLANPAKPKADLDSWLRLGKRKP